MKKVASSSELANAPTHETIGQIETIIDKFWVFFATKPQNPEKKQRHPLKDAVNYDRWWEKTAVFSKIHNIFKLV